MKKIMSASRVVRDLQQRVKVLKKNGVTYKALQDKAGVKARWFLYFRNREDPNTETRLLDALERAVVYYEAAFQQKENT